MEMISSDKERLVEALLFLWDLRKRDDPGLVVINYTDRRTVRRMLGRELCEEIGLMAKRNVS
jgi:hypothetical protein